MERKVEKMRVQHASMIDAMTGILAGARALEKEKRGGSR